MKGKLNLRKKLSSKKGGFKELLYDNIAIIVVVVLVSFTIVSFAGRVRDLGEDVVGNGDGTKGILQETIEEVKDSIEMQ